MPSEIFFEDQTLRDGLQSETRLFAMDEKRRLIALLTAAGFKYIQVGAFVHPRRVPQMADTDELVRNLEPPSDVAFSGLVLNARGLERAMACGLTNVALSASVSDSHSRRNTNQGADAAIAAMIDLIREALAAGLTVQGGLQCVFGCVYEGAVDADRVVAAAERMAAAGATAICLADTTGMAHPRQVETLCRRIQRALPEVELTLHLHDTRGLGLANMLAGYDAGIRRFDVCAGGLGGLSLRSRGGRQRAGRGCRAGFRGHGRQDGHRSGGPGQSGGLSGGQARTPAARPYGRGAARRPEPTWL